MEQQNMSFMNAPEYCEICGSRDDPFSEVRLTFGYGSINDGERVTLNVCGDCIDKLYDIIQSGNIER